MITHGQVQSIEIVSADGQRLTLDPADVASVEVEMVPGRGWRWIASADGQHLLLDPASVEVEADPRRGSGPGMMFDPAPHVSATFIAKVIDEGVRMARLGEPVPYRWPAQPRSRPHRRGRQEGRRRRRR